MEVDRITVTPGKMGGRPCIRGLRITVDQIVLSLARGQSIDQILNDFPYLEREDIIAAQQFAACESDRRKSVMPRC